MARPQKFDEKQVISKAMMYFWEHGYSGSSIQQLLDEMTISRGTLYNAVGDKDALFKRCLETYSAMSEQLFAMTLLNTNLPPKERMEKFIQLSFMSSENAHLGCLMVNTVCEDERAVEGVKSLSLSVMNAMEHGFNQCFSELATNMKPDAAASIMATQIKGSRVRQREGIDNSLVSADLLTVLNQLLA